MADGRRSFADICRRAQAYEAPATFGGRAIVAIEDWMTERGARRLTLQREPDGSWTVALDIARDNWTQVRGPDDVEALQSTLCEAVAAVFAAAEKSEAAKP